MTSQIAFDVQPEEQHVLQQERLRALSQMASGIAHDINNSLTPIIGYSDFLLDSDATLPPEIRRCLECIRSAAGNIADTVEHVRQFYRRREVHEPWVQVDLNELTQQVLNETELTPGGPGRPSSGTIELETEWASVPPFVFGNPGELRQAIGNLITNACEAMPKGGTLFICTSWLKPQSNSAGTPETRVQVEVRDTGVGMDESIKRSCFEPFFSTKGKRGSGLGLAMVYGTMRRHEGTIEVDSVPNEGTSMRLLFRSGNPTSNGKGAV